MHSESEIRKAIRPLLDKFGELNTSEVKELLHFVLEYDEDDMIASPTRNEYRITQRIGNIVAHQKNNIQAYSEGFIVDKTTLPAKFIALNGLSTNKKPIDKKDISKRKKKEKLFTAKKINWDEKRLRDEELGNMGEEFVYEFEKDKVNSFDPSSVDRVLHLSRLQGDGLGYDISSIDKLGNILRIEVKTTTGNCDTPFFMSENEKLFFDIYKDDGAYIYRVHNFNKQTRRGKLHIISADDLFKNYTFNPVNYLVTKK